MNIEKYVMAYGVEQDRIRALLPEGFTSLRPVLRINAEICDERGYLEFNVPVQQGDFHGWLNIGCREDAPFLREGRTVTFRGDLLTISFTGVGIKGSCPAEKANDGCVFLGETPRVRPPETITVNKEFCDCEFRWHFSAAGAHGRSIGKTLPAYPQDVKVVYPPQAFTVENAAVIPCAQVLGTYAVRFEREGGTP